MLLRNFTSHASTEHVYRGPFLKDVGMMPNAGQLFARLHMHVHLLSPRFVRYHIPISLFCDSISIDTLSLLE